MAMLLFFTNKKGKVCFLIAKLINFAIFKKQFTKLFISQNKKNKT
jgi:hypothetical protein